MKKGTKVVTGTKKVAETTTAKKVETKVAEKAETKKVVETKVKAEKPTEAKYIEIAKSFGLELGGIYNGKTIVFFRSPSPKEVQKGYTLAIKMDNGTSRGAWAVLKPAETEVPAKTATKKVEAEVPEVKAPAKTTKKVAAKKPEAPEAKPEAPAKKGLAKKAIARRKK